ASVRANLHCESVVIRGEVYGDIEAARKIAFHRGAHVHGEMKASAIVIEEGAQFHGTIVIGGDAREPVALPARAEAGGEEEPEGCPGLLRRPRRGTRRARADRGRAPPRPPTGRASRSPGRGRAARRAGPGVRSARPARRSFPAD